MKPVQTAAGLSNKIYGTKVQEKQKETDTLSRIPSNRLKTAMMLQCSCLETERSGLSYCSVSFWLSFSWNVSGRFIKPAVCTVQVLLPPMETAA